MKIYIFCLAMLLLAACNNKTDSAVTARDSTSTINTYDSTAFIDYPANKAAVDSAIAQENEDTRLQEANYNGNYLRPDHETIAQEISWGYTPKEIYLELMRRTGVFKKDSLPPFIRKNFRVNELRHILDRFHPLRKESSRDLFEAFDLGLERQGLIIGNDNRTDLSYGRVLAQRTPVANGNAQPDARCVMAIVRKDSLTPDGHGHYIFKHKATFQDVFHVCDSERFCKQPSFSAGTGFVVNNTTMITAAHCIDSNNYNKFYFVFDYMIDADGNFNKTIDDSLVFEAQSVQAKLDSFAGIDYSIVKLNRRVDQSRIPVLDTSGATGKGSYYFVIGTPCGLPLKLADSARVKDNINANYFTMKSDTYQGNSGSPVFNAVTHVIEGILTAGDKDFKFIAGMPCRKSITCPESVCSRSPNGERVSRVSQFYKLIK